MASGSVWRAADGVAVADLGQAGGVGVGDGHHVGLRVLAPAVDVHAADAQADDAHAQACGRRSAGRASAGPSTT
jgi:hypothetical protein